jgi:hypothetical protein
MAALLVVSAFADAPSCAPGIRILSRERRAPPPTGPPPSLPEDLRWAFTRCGAAAVGEFFVDDTRGGKGTHYTHSRADMNARVAAARSQLERTAPLRGALNAARQVEALKNARVASKVRGGACVVFGSTAPTVEALLIAGGAASVVVVEYNNLTYDHFLVSHAKPSDFADGEHARFDVAISFSSFDHDGLGRYGDPLAPDGDLLAMDFLAGFLAPGGVALVSVPVGTDTIWWNLMREYGPVRLPLLLEGFQVIDRIGWDESKLGNPRANPGPGIPYEPVFVLSRASTEAADL